MNEAFMRGYYEAYNSEDPDRLGEFLADDVVLVSAQGEQHGKAAYLATYRGIIADPPWAAEPEEDDPDRLARGYYPYPTMSVAAIAALPVASIAHDDCVLGLWITNFHLALGHHLEILKAWDFKPVTIRTWVKDRMGRGQVLRGQTEHQVIATRGKPVIQVANITTFFHGAIDKKQHSLKPQKSFDDFERLVAAPRYATLFETADRGAKWDGHGDQVAKATSFKEAAE